MQLKRRLGNGKRGRWGNACLEMKKGKIRLTLNFFKYNWDHVYYSEKRDYGCCNCSKQLYS